MKLLKIFGLILLTAFIISSCKKKEVTLSSQPENDIELRDGITYNTKTNMPFVGKYVNYYPKSKTKEMELNYKDGLLDGEIFCYSENGQTDYDVNFSMGKLNGRYKHWIQSGELMFDFDIDTNASIIPTYAYPQGEKLLYYYFNHSIPLDTILSLLGTEYT